MHAAKMCRYGQKSVGLFLVDRTNFRAYGKMCCPPLRRLSSVCLKCMYCGQKVRLKEKLPEEANGLTLPLPCGTHSDPLRPLRPTTPKRGY